VGGASIGNPRGDERATLSGTRQAFFDGDFEAALSACQNVRARDSAAQFEIAALRARILLRLDRPELAIDALRVAAFKSLSLDQHVTAQMLLGAAYVRLGQSDRGIALLVGAQESSVGAHSTIRAEVALNLGIAQYRAGNYEAAETLFASVPGESDIVYGRALEYRGWLAQARGDVAAAAQWFTATFDTLERCTHRDRYLEASAMYGLAMLSPSLMLLEQWPSVQRRIRAFDWSVSGVLRWRFWILVAASMMSEILGDIDQARDCARDAELLAENPGYCTVALCRAAEIFRGLQQPDAQREFTARARLTYEKLNIRELDSDLQQVPLYVAQQLLYAGDIQGARVLLGQYRDLIAPTLRMPPADVERFDALARSLTASIHEAQGERPQAVQEFTTSFHVSSRMGDRRQATEIALHLARLTGKKRYVDYATAALRGAGGAFWMSRQLATIQAGEGPQLTATESVVLTLLVAGKTYKEIAAERHVSVKTVDHRVQTLFRKFSVHSRGELAAEALRRRLVRLAQDA
jgi:DNA-binding CsgD family transcriptional regulator/tetratricopeptide (TPR) repeat protein